MGAIIARMTFIELLLIAIALSMDAFAVSICYGIKNSRFNLRHTLIVALFFGFFQFLMPLIGWGLSSAAHKYIEAYDHWVAFALLLGIGVKTIIDGFNSRDTQLKVHAMFDWKSLLLMGLAVSIDAFAVGISLKMVQVALWEVCLTVPVVVFLVSVLGVFLGFHSHKLVQKLSLPVINLIGGLVLIGIGLRILIEHLSA